MVAYVRHELPIGRVVGALHGNDLRAHVLMVLGDVLGKLRLRHRGAEHQYLVCLREQLGDVAKEAVIVIGVVVNLRLVVLRVAVDMSVRPFDGFLVEVLGIDMKDARFVVIHPDGHLVHATLQRKKRSSRDLLRSVGEIGLGSACARIFCVNDVASATSVGLGWYPRRRRTNVEPMRAIALAVVVLMSSCGGNDDRDHVDISGRSPAQAASIAAKAICQTAVKCGSVRISCAGGGSNTGETVPTTCTGSIEPISYDECFADARPDLEKVLGCRAFTSDEEAIIEDCINAMAGASCTTQAEADELARRAEMGLGGTGRQPPPSCAQLTDLFAMCR